MLKKVLNLRVTLLSGQNYRSLLIKKNIIISLILRGLSVIINLLLVPLTIKFVNVTQYGVWLTLSSVISWFSFFDVGLGNGLKNKLAESNALGKTIDSKIYISTTYAILSIISVSIFVLVLLTYKVIGWNKILNVPVSQVINIDSIVLIIAICFCLQFIFQLINVVSTALHAPTNVSLLLLIGQFISLIIIYFLSYKIKGSLILLVTILAGVPVLVQFIANIFLYKIKYKEIAPSFKFVDLKYLKELLSLGGIFFIIQMGQLILYQTDNLVITNLFGPKEVTTFNVSYKLFSVVVIVFTVFINPFWSAFTDAYVKQDFPWIKKTFLKMQKSWLIVILATFILLALSPFLLHIWLKDMVIVPISLSFFIALYMITSCWHMLCCFFLNGINKIRLQLYAYIVCFLINIPMAIILAKSLGLIGVVISNIICFVAMGLLFYVQCNKIINNKATGIWNR